MHKADLQPDIVDSLPPVFDPQNTYASGLTDTAQRQVPLLIRQKPGRWLTEQTAKTQAALEGVVMFFSLASALTQTPRAIHRYREKGSLLLLQ